MSATKKPVCIIAIGMAGSGKSTFVQRINAHLHARTPPAPPYVLNLDPAVTNVPFEANIDIRDTVDYHEVMKQYNLGPNGAILTALNLFTTKFDQVLDLVEKRAESVDYVIVDTPGAIITDAVASSLPTVIAYIVDTPRATAPATFMSNMLYACSILYKTKLPFIVVFNKIDAQPHDFALNWMQDFETFQEALATHRSTTDDEGAPTYMNSLMNSMSLVLDEFYKHLKSVGVSSVTGDGVSEFFEAVEASREEYEQAYLPELARMRAQREATLQKQKDDSTARMLADLAVDRTRNPRSALQDRWNPQEEEDEDEEDDGGELNIIDRSEEPWPGQYVDLTQARRREDSDMAWPRPT
ncbi:XPA-binding protein 1 [Lactarius hatsudake]|nr:XPA-binding protein 1 [Lactarius hatsudake]